jgi:soluble lytic murein transglycosylase-like protein
VAAAPGSSIPQYVEPPPATAISPIFTPEVQHWGPQLVAWGKQYAIDPNMLATVMQIESCGDWLAGSSAGAQGLFQVMPFHFTEGENPQDPDTNAKAGITYLKDSLEYAGGHFGLALAGYNGGHGVISVGWARWADETKRYYLWGSGIYEDAVQGKTTSPALQSWLNAGGSILCNQAANRIAGTPSAIASN